MSKNWRKILIGGYLLALFSVGHSAMAQITNSSDQLYGGTDQKSAVASTFANLGLSSDDPRIVAGRIIEILLGFLGLIAVGLIMYAGWLYMNAAGQAEKIEKAKNILKNAAIGLLIILSAFSIVTWLMSSLLGVTLGDEWNQNSLPGGGNWYGDGGFHLSGHLPGNNETDVFRNASVLLEFNSEIAHNQATSTYLKITKTKEYQLTSSEHSISSSTAFVATNIDIPVTVSTTTGWRSTALRPVATCDYFNGSATTTVPNCLPEWSEYQVKVENAFVSMGGAPINCSGNYGCTFVFTTNNSFDVGRPVIKALSPVGGFCLDDNATSTPLLDQACLSDNDCQVAGHAGRKCDRTTPNAKAGNFVTISGKNFGTNPGHVWFIDNQSSSTVEAKLANDSTYGNTNCSENVWQDDQIIAVMPEGFTAGASTSIRVKEVTTPDQWEDVSNDSFGPKLKNLLVDAIERPGLCTVDPQLGTTSAKMTYQGVKLFATVGNTYAYFGALGQMATASNPFISLLTNTGNVPAVNSGTTTTFALRGKNYSNNLAFKKLEDEYSGPKITSFDPLTGQKGQYITISGSGFGQASSKTLGVSYRAVFAEDAGIVSSSSMLAKITVDHTAFPVDFKSFPQVCSDDLWSDNQVIVKAPVGLNYAAHKSYYLYLIFPRESASSSWIISSEAIPFETNTIKRQFVANDAVPLAPGLCSIKPLTGLVKDQVDLFGEYFPATTVEGDVQFSKNINSAKASTTWKQNDAITINGLTLGKADHATTFVPNNTVTGPVAVVKTISSNKINFNLGSCKKDVDCGGSSFCCPAGSVHEGRCQTGSTVQTACFSSITTSVYEWSFSTSEALLAATCSGYTNANACMLSASCPNSPGSCQSGNGVSNGDCSNDFCNTTYPECGGNCSYDKPSNKCVLNGSTCNSSNDLTGAQDAYYNADGANALSKFKKQDGGPLTAADGLTIETEVLNKVYAATGQNHWYSISDFIPVDTSRSYYLAARFKNVGTKSAHTYLGFDPYDQNKVGISVWQVQRYGQPVVINSVSATELDVTGDMTAWNNSGTRAGNRTLAFYFDGDTTKLPPMSAVYMKYAAPVLQPEFTWTGDNAYYDLANSQGAYSALTANKIMLNGALPANILSQITLGTTKVMDHSAGGTFLYSSAIGNDAPHDWVTYGGFIAGEAFGNDPNIFRPTTKFVKLTVGMNYMSPGDADPSGYKEYVDDIIFTPTACNTVSGQGVYQIDVKGQSCLPGTFLDINGKCTVGTPLSPKTCSLCASGFGCDAGKCAIDKPVCKKGSNCAAGKCVADFTCECCCKVDNAAQDCCAGLKCSPGLCANDQKDIATNQPIYGQCTGCKVQVGGVLNQAASDASCNCKAGAANRFCNVAPKVFVNGAWKDNPDGICQDAAQEGQPCKADLTAGTATTNSTSQTVTVSDSQQYWVAAAALTGGVLSFQDASGEYLPIAEPITCLNVNATSSSIFPGYVATCIAGLSGNHWSVRDHVPCPVGTYLSLGSHDDTSDCLVASSSTHGLPKSCASLGATTTAQSLLSGSASDILTCTAASAWYKPHQTYNSTTTVTASTTYKPGVLVGNTAYYWQTTDPLGVNHGYVDRNATQGHEIYTYAPASVQSTIATCTPGVVPTQALIAGYQANQFICTPGAFYIGANSFGYWRFNKEPNRACPVGSALMAAGDGAGLPRCIVGAKPASRLKTSANGSVVCDESHLDKVATSSDGLAYSCIKANFVDSGAAYGLYCSDTSLPTCAPGLFCDPNGCTCQKAATTTVTSEVRSGELCVQGPMCPVGIDSCDTSKTQLSCLTSGGSDCRCCCTPGSTRDIYDDAGNKTNTLKCQPNETPCSGGARGLFCGCKQDNECSGASNGCGLDTCCRARPVGSSTFPFNNSVDVCRNTLISLTFNQAMDPASFNGNVILAADKGTSGQCPAGTYLTTIKGRQFSFLERIFLWVKRIFNTSDTAYAVSDHNYCAIEGKVSAGNSNKTLNFAPSKLLDPNTTYYVVVRGDDDITNALTEGVVSAQGIGFHDAFSPDNGSLPGTGMNALYAASSNNFNGRDYFGYVWHFTTKALSAENNGVCLVDKIKIDTDGMGGSSWMFNKSTKDNTDNLTGASFDQVDDNDKAFYGRAYSKEGKEISSIPGAYAWGWTWSSENSTVAQIGGAPEYNLIASGSVQQIAAQNKQDAQTFIDTSIRVTDDTAVPGELNKTKAAKATVHVFLCNNPWPPRNPLAPAAWPWQDSSTCKPGTGTCDNNNFKFYYCRDNGKNSPDDLPAIANSNASLLGNLKGQCDAGYWYGIASVAGGKCASAADCVRPVAANYKCEGALGNKYCKAYNGASLVGTGGRCFIDADCQSDGQCKLVSKEYYFMRDFVPASDNFNLSATPNPHGGAVGLSWASVPGVAGYHLYYGLSTRSYGDPIDITDPLVISKSITGLTNGKRYYFAITSYTNNTKAESPFSAEVIANTADTWAPVTPTINMGATQASTTASGTVKIVWSKPNPDGDADEVKYRVYYKFAGAASYADSVDVNVTSASDYSLDLNNLSSNVAYKFAITAIDKYSNESNRSGEVTLTTY